MKEIFTNQMRIKKKGKNIMFIESEKAKISRYNGCGGLQVCDYDADGK